MAHPHPDPDPAPPPSTPPRFSGRAAVITGAARGIGRAHAVALAREGCDLVLCDVLEGLPDGTPYPKATQQDLDQTAELAQSHGVRCVALKADVADADQARQVVERAQSEFGRLDFLIANAGLTLEGPLSEISAKTFDTVIRANLHGVFHVLSPALRIMQAQGRGRIVVIGSGLSKHAEAEAGPYAASKFALVGLVKTAALEVAKSGVTANLVLPGPTDTPMMSSKQRMEEAVPDKVDPSREDYLQAKKDATPMGYAWVKPEDVAAASLFLLSDEARFISGDALSVDAADCAHWS
jgi:NAD(P)-dependent dehydrogenase (short-subunit alcohol dehydrogenase family)